MCASHCRARTAIAGITLIKMEENKSKDRVIIANQGVGVGPDRASGDCSTRPICQVGEKETATGTTTTEVLHTDMIEDEEVFEDSNMPEGANPVDASKERGENKRKERAKRNAQYLEDLDITEDSFFSSLLNENIREELSYGTARVYTLSSESMEEVDAEENTQRKKRRRISKSTPQRKKDVKEAQSGRLKGYLNKANEITDQLRKFCRDNRNVHTVIKKLALELEEVMQEACKINKRVQKRSIKEEISFCEENRFLETENRKLKEENAALQKKIKDLGFCATEMVEVQRELRNIKSRRNSVGSAPVNNATSVRKITVEASTQTAGSEEMENELKTRDLRMKMASMVDEEDLREIVESDWPKETYLFAETEETIIDMEHKGDTVVFGDMFKYKDSKLVERITCHSAAIRKYIKEGKLKDGQVISFKSGGEITLDNIEVKEEKYVLFMGVKEEEPISIYKTARKIRQQFMERKPKQLHIAWIGAGIQQARKIAECVLHDCADKVVWHIGRRKTNKRDNKRKDEAIIMNTGEKTYADTLKDLRLKLVGTREAEAIKSVEKTRTGQVKIVVSGKGCAAPMLALLRTKLGKGKARMAGEKKKTLHIKGMDEITTEEEIILALQEVGISKDVVEVKNLRPMQRGSTRAATLIMAPAAAEKLLAVQTVRVGLASCIVRERLEVPTCFRCWESGHVAEKCSGTDRSKSCKNCGQDGHMAKECDAESHCPLCKKEGHRANTLACPKFREELDRVARIKRQAHL